MLYFPPLRTRRLDVTLRELTMAEAIELTHINPDTHEAATAALLVRIVKEARGAHADPRRWTLQERAVVVAHYFGVTLDEPNFEVGGGHYHDYLDAAADYPGDESEPFEACGKIWRVRHVLGAEAEMLEALSASRRHWIVGDMAMRLMRDDTDTRPDATDEPGRYGEWLQQRMHELNGLPETEFAQLYAACHQHVQQLRHLFDLGCDKHGYTVLPRTEAGAGGVALAPTRFPVAACLSPLAFALRE